MMAFVYRRSEGSVVDPSRMVTDLARGALGLDEGWRVSVMQMSCGACGDPDCGEIETTIMAAPPEDAQGAKWRRLRIGKEMRLVTASDIRRASEEERRWKRRAEAPSKGMCVGG